MSSTGSFPDKRQKIELPKLKWEYDALEPYISGEINRIHHTKHHQAYVNNYNAAIEALVKAEAEGNVNAIIALQQDIKFNAGGYVNHVYFFGNLSPKNQSGGKIDENSPLGKQVTAQYGSFEKLIDVTNKKLAKIQGSGWAFIVKNVENGNNIDVVTTFNQDTVSHPLVPLVAIDAWEHAYYLQYQNQKLDYFKAIWNVVDWNEANERFRRD